MFEQHIQAREQCSVVIRPGSEGPQRVTKRIELLLSAHRETASVVAVEPHRHRQNNALTSLLHDNAGTQAEATPDLGSGIPIAERHALLAAELLLQRLPQCDGVEEVALRVVAQIP
jgi:hypothetical protein